MKLFNGSGVARPTLQGNMPNEYSIKYQPKHSLTNSIFPPNSPVFARLVYNKRTLIDDKTALENYFDKRKINTSFAAVRQHVSTLPRIVGGRGRVYKGGKKFVITWHISSFLHSLPTFSLFACVIISTHRASSLATAKPYGSNMVTTCVCARRVDTKTFFIHLTRRVLENSESK